MAHLTFWQRLRRYFSRVSDDGSEEQREAAEMMSWLTWLVSLLRRN